MNDDVSMPAVSPDDVAAYAVDAHEPQHALRIAARLAADAASVRMEQALRAAAGELAAAIVEELPPSGTLRGRVLAAARRRRPPAVAGAGASPIEVHRVELARTLLLLRDLRTEDWGCRVDPPELAGWTVHDVVVHLVANESLLAVELAAPVARITETAGDNEGRTAQARARHAGRSPAEAVGELEAAAAAVDRAVTTRGETRLHDTIDWWGERPPIRLALLVRAFENWTHTDDIRRAVGAAMVPPPPASLLTMAHTAVGFTPRLLALRGVQHPGRLVRFRFTDLADTAWDVDLGAPGGIRPAGDEMVDAEIVADAVATCRVMSARIAPGALDHEVIGDEQLARDVIAALPAMAFV